MTWPIKVRSREAAVQGEPDCTTMQLEPVRAQLDRRTRAVQARRAAHQQRPPKR